MGSVTCSRCFRESIFTGWEMIDDKPVCKDCVEEMELYDTDDIDEINKLKLTRN